MDLSTGSRESSLLDRARGDLSAVEGCSIELQPFYERLERKARKAMEALTRRAGTGAPAVAGVIVRGRRAEETVKSRQPLGR